VLAASAAFDLRHQVCWQAQVLRGLVQGLRRLLRLAPITLEAFMRLQATALSGCCLLFGVSFAGGHSVLLQTVVLARHSEKETRSPNIVSANVLHGSERFILQNKEPVTHRAAALQRAAQREKGYRAMQSASSSRDSILLW
jgi:hypothetical protein